MAANKHTTVERGQPLPVSELVKGEYYECILTQNRVLVKDTGNDTAIGRYFNRLTGEYVDFQVAGKQLRRIL